MRHITTLAIAVFPAVAVAMDTLDISPCMLAAPQVETTTDRLTAIGWTLQDIKTLDDITLTHLAWMRTAIYLNGDSGGEAIEDILALQLKTVKGIARKVDLPTGKTRVMIRTQGSTQDTVLITWQKPIAANMNTTCQFAQTRAEVTPVDMPLALTSQPFDASDATATRTTTITKLNTGKLSTDITSLTQTYWEAK